MAYLATLPHTTVYFAVTIEKLSFHHKVRLRLKLFHSLLENCWNNGRRDQLILKGGGRNVAGHLQSDYKEGVPGNQDIAPLCGESLEREQVITRLEQAGIET